MALRRYPWRARELFEQDGGHHDFLEMMGKDIAVKVHGAVCFYKCFDDNEPEVITQYKKLLTRRGFPVVQLLGMELTESAIAEAQFAQSIHSIEEEET